MTDIEKVMKVRDVSIGRTRCPDCGTPFDVKLPAPAPEWDEQDHLAQLHWTDAHIVERDGEHVAYDEAGQQLGHYRTHDDARDALVVHGSTL